MILKGLRFVLEFNFLIITVVFWKIPGLTVNSNNYDRNVFLLTD